MNRVIQKLAEYFTNFPGIGPRQATRFVFFLLSQEQGFRDELARMIRDIRSQTLICDSCFRIFEDDHSGKTSCEICSNQSRDTHTLLVVEKDTDLDAVEKSGMFKGHYFVLGGTVPILEKEPEKRVRIRELVNRVAKKDGLTEIILANSVNPEGENTQNIVEHAVRDIAAERGIRITTLGKGLSTGSELEYVDSDTIENALKNRR